VEKTFLRKKQILWMGERKSLPGGRELSNRWTGLWGMVGHRIGIGRITIFATECFWNRSFLPDSFFNLPYKWDQILRGVMQAWSRSNAASPFTPLEKFYGFFPL
jgi:hypothetical protein